MIALFLALAGHSAAVRGQAGPMLAEVRLDSRILELRLSVDNGPPEWFVIDSGSPMSFLRDKPDVDVKAPKGFSITLGGKTLAVIRPSSEASPIDAGHDGLAGLLGDDFLGQVVLAVDPAAKRAALWPKRTFASAALGAWMAKGAAKPKPPAVVDLSTDEQGLPLIQKATFGHAVLPAVLDTGSAVCFLPEPALQTIPHYVIGKRPVETWDKTVNGSIALILSVSVGGHSESTPLIAINSDDETPPIIGESFLGTTKWALDVSGERLWLGSLTEPQDEKPMELPGGAQLFLNNREWLLKLPKGFSLPPGDYPVMYLEGLAVHELLLSTPRRGKRETEHDFEVREVIHYGKNIEKVFSIFSKAEEGGRLAFGVKVGVRTSTVVIEMPAAKNADAGPASSSEAAAPAAPTALDRFEAPFACSNALLIVEARVGGQTGWFVLDSGRRSSSIDKAFLARIKNARAVAKRGQTGLYRVQNVQVGGACLSSGYFQDQVPDDLRSTRVGDVRVAGVLGYNILRQMCVGIDFDEHRTWVWGAEDASSAGASFFPPDTRATSLPLSSQMSLPVAEAALNGRPFCVYTDIAYTLIYAANQPQAWFGKDVAVSDAPAGQSSERVAVPHSIDLGGAEFRCPPVVTWPTGNDLPTVGWSAFLALHRVLFDFDEGVIQYASPSEPIRGLNLTLGPLGAEIDDRDLIDTSSFADPVRIPLQFVGSVNGLAATVLDAHPADWRAEANSVARVTDSFNRSGALRIALHLPGGSSVLDLRGLEWTPVHPQMPPSLAYAGKFVDGPGVYLCHVPRGSATAAAIDGAVKLDAGRFVLPADGTWSLFPVGGVPTPLAEDLPKRPGFVALTVPHARSEVEYFKMPYVRSTGLELSLAGDEVYPAHKFSTNHFVCVPPDATVENSDWTAVPMGNGMIAYYPPDWHIPFVSNNSPPGPGVRPPGIAPAGSAWIFFHGQWGLTAAPGADTGGRAITRHATINVPKGVPFAIPFKSGPQPCPGPGSRTVPR